MRATSWKTVLDPLIEMMVSERDALARGDYIALRPIRSQPNDHELQRFAATRPSLWPNLQTHDDLLGALAGPDAEGAAAILKDLIRDLEKQLLQERVELQQRYSSSIT